MLKRHDPLQALFVIMRDLTAATASAVAATASAVAATAAAVAATASAIATSPSATATAIAAAPAATSWSTISWAAATATKATRCCHCFQGWGHWLSSLADDPCQLACMPAVGLGKESVRLACNDRVEGSQQSAL